MHLQVVIIRTADQSKTGEVSDFYGDTAQADLDQWKAARPETFGPDQEFDLVVTDMTAEDQALADEATGLTKMSLGERCVARLYAINTRKGWDAAAIMKALHDPNLQDIERCLKNGAPELAKQLIAEFGPGYYTPEEIQTIIAPIA
jgi:hypothetical protein